MPVDIIICTCSTCIPCILHVHVHTCGTFTYMQCVLQYSIYAIVHFVASTHLHTCTIIHVNTIDHFLTILHITCV